jgi:hypothetical protein
VWNLILLRSLVYAGRSNTSPNPFAQLYPLSAPRGSRLRYRHDDLAVDDDAHGRASAEAMSACGSAAVIANPELTTDLARSRPQESGSAMERGR